MMPTQLQLGGGELLSDGGMQGRAGMPPLGYG